MRIEFLAAFAVLVGDAVPQAVHVAGAGNVTDVDFHLAVIGRFAGRLAGEPDQFMIRTGHGNAEHACLPGDHRGQGGPIAGEGSILDQVGVKAHAVFRGGGVQVSVPVASGGQQDLIVLLPQGAGDGAVLGNHVRQFLRFGFGGDGEGKAPAVHEMRQNIIHGFGAFGLGETAAQEKYH